MSQLCPKDAKDFKPFKNFSGTACNLCRETRVEIIYINNFCGHKFCYLCSLNSITYCVICRDKVSQQAPIVVQNDIVASLNYFLR